MSILKKCENGWIVSHQDYMKIDLVEEESTGQVKTVRFNSDFFQVNSPFRRRKVKKLKKNKNSKTEDDGTICTNFETNIESQLSEITRQVKNLSSTILQEGRASGIFVDLLQSEKCDDNLIARKAAIDFFGTIKTFQNYPQFCARNDFDVGVKKILFDGAGNFHNFICPPKSVLYSDSIDVLDSLNDNRYSLILMDPPWRNKYIRRRKRKQLEAGYYMMDTLDIGKLPIREMANDKALIAVWCTNSTSHQHALKKLFKSWGVDYLTTWYWLKVTREGEPVCPFNIENSKQPYETIILGRKNSTLDSTSYNEPVPLESVKIVVSIPSTINSHKPPLIEILRPYIFETELNCSNCCELFARYGLPNFTSIGNEVVKLLHESLYDVE